jgi:DNA repair protein RecO (recombination protein O)
MARFQTEGIVLKHFDLGEADKIITFYTRDKGKVRAVARGVRKVKNRLSGLVLPFSYNEIKIYRGRSIDQINHIESKYSFGELRGDLAKMAYASYMAEVVEKVGKEDNPNMMLFSLLLAAYYQILEITDKQAYRLELVNLKFKTNLLSVLGFKPELKLCIECESEIKLRTNNFFSISRGGTICNSCINDTDEYVFNLSGESLIILRRFLDPELVIPENLKISQKAFQSLNKLIDQFITYHLEITIKSEKFLHMIKNFG